MQAFRHLLLTYCCCCYLLHVDRIFLDENLRKKYNFGPFKYSKLGEVNLRSEYIGMYVLYIFKKLFQPHDTTPRCVIDCTFFSISSPVSSLQTLIIVSSRKKTMYANHLFPNSLYIIDRYMCKQYSIFGTSKFSPKATHTTCLYLMANMYQSST